MNIARQSHALRKRLERKYLRKVASQHQSVHASLQDSFEESLSDRDLGNYISYPPLTTN